MQNHLPFEQKKIRSRKRKKVAWLSGAWILGVAVIIYGLSFIASIHYFRITAVSVSGNNRVSTADIQSLATRDMTGDFLWIFPHTSYFFVPTGKISSDIMQNFPVVDTVSVHRSGLNSLSIDMKEKIPEALWCGDAICTVLDEIGTAFDIQSNSATATDMVIFESSTTPAIGQSPVSGGFSQVLIFINGLAARGLNPTIADVKTGEIDITVASTSMIIIDPTKDLTQALANLDLILSNPESPLQKNGISAVQYIDLRFDGKVFYKNVSSNS